MSDEQITPEDAKSLADKVIDEHVVPKKVPAFDDIEGQAKAVSGALASALLTATEMPLTVLNEVLGAVSEQMVALGIRQTEHVDPDAVYAPGWLTDGARQQAVKLPEQPKHTEAEPFVARTATAPKQPKRITKATRAVRL